MKPTLSDSVASDVEVNRFLGMSQSVNTHRLLRRRAQQLSTGLVCLVLAASFTLPAGGADASPTIGSEGKASRQLQGTTAVPGASIVAKRRLTGRTVELTVDTPSFVDDVRVEVMLPKNYGEQRRRTWPVTYHLNGTNGDQTWFRTVYAGERLTQSFESIVVAPAGHAGYWSDWYNAGAQGPPKYETFVTRQLIPLIDANFRTKADRAHRAIMGDSMGGYGALMLAARHPDLFVAASSLSGAVDTNYAPGAAALAASSSIDLAPPAAIYGSRLADEVRWRGHNPKDLANNLRNVDLQLYTGNGIPRLEEASGPPVICVVESGIVQPETKSLHRTLQALNIPHKFVAYNWGCHTPFMFQKEIESTLPRFSRVFDRAVSTPRAFNYRSIEPRFTVHGWSVRADRSRPLEFLRLDGAHRGGVRVTGSGRTVVLTPRWFQPSTWVRVHVGKTPLRVRATTTGRLKVLVDLGPVSERQQYLPGSVTRRRTQTVTFG